MTTSFADYLSPAADGFAAYHSQFAGAFGDQRLRIAQVVGALQPKTVACFGAGGLSDIPFGEFLLAGTEVHLVDWVDGILEFGLANSILTHHDTGPECVFCELDEAQATDYCLNYSWPQPEAGVCGAYVPATDGSTGCKSYRAGEQPHLHRADVTGGFASQFGEAISRGMGDVRSWRQALRLGAAHARTAKSARRILDLPDTSIDLITASMLISQFEHEPYAYFSRRASELLGPPSVAEEKRLQGAVESLRTDLLRTQIDRLGEEIRRLLTPDGRCYLSFEMFHQSDGEDSWFLVAPMVEALGRLGAVFDFDFETVPEATATGGFRGAEGHSVIHQYLLKAKL